MKLHELRGKRLVRWSLSLMTGIVFAYLALGAILYKVNTYDAIHMIGERPFNDMTKTAIDIRLDLSRNMFQLGLLVLGALWGLIIAKRSEAGITLSDRPELLMFTVASLSLVLSFWLHYLYVNDISDSYALSGRICADVDYQCVPDVMDVKIESALDYQLSFLLAGFVIAAITLLSAHKLKERS